MKNINFNLSDELFKKFKKHCVDLNCTMTKKIVDLIKEELKSNQQK